MAGDRNRTLPIWVDAAGVQVSDPQQNLGLARLIVSRNFAPGWGVLSPRRPIQPLCRRSNQAVIALAPAGRSNDGPMHPSWASLGRYVHLWVRIPLPATVLSQDIVHELPVLHVLHEHGGDLRLWPAAPPASICNEAKRRMLDDNEPVLVTVLGETAREIASFWEGVIQADRLAPNLRRPVPRLSGTIPTHAVLRGSVVAAESAPSAR
jgi:hypothetical protein